MEKNHVFLLIIVILFFINTLIFPQTRLLRYPDIYKDKIVFTYGGDLWIVSSKGGVARQLTSHPGLEIFPRFSPDGKWIAFTGEYDGNRGVYVIPTQGGEPKRLTYRRSRYSEFRHGYDNMVLGWCPDGKSVLFRSWRDSFDTWFEKLFKVSIKGGLPEELPLPEAGMSCFSPDGTKIVYTPIFRDFRTWKRYRGGLAQDIWIYDFKLNKSRKLTKWKGTDHYPLWYKNYIYFVSDRNGRENFFKYDLKTNKITQVTFHKDYDIKWPDIGINKIVYENGGWIYVLDLKTDKYKKIDIYVPSEKRWKRPYYKNVSSYIEDFALSYDAKKTLISARGDIFCVKLKNNYIKNLTNTPGARDIKVSFSPNGKYIAYISDITGEYELYIKSKDKTIKLTNNNIRDFYYPIWSPDSKKLLFSDRSSKLYYIDINTKKLITIDKCKNEPITHYSWSPDSKWVVYRKIHENKYGSIYLYSLKENKSYQITDELTDDAGPVFGLEGKYIYFRSRRVYKATLDFTEMTFISDKDWGLYIILLNKEDKSPFYPKYKDDDEKKEEKAKNTKKDKKSNKKKNKEKTIKIDLENIQNRIIKIPVKGRNYLGLRTVKGGIVYASYENWTMGGEEAGGFNVYKYDIKSQKEIKLITNISNYDVSGDGTKLIYKAGDTLGVIDINSPHKIGDGKIDLSNLEMKIVPAEEWKQIFNEAWRLERDRFYAPNYHGVNWKEIKKKYEVLVPYAAHRDDLVYIISEMIGELGCSHTYVGRGDYPEVKRIKSGLLGAKLKLDKKSNRYYFAKIYKGENWSKDAISPLTMPGINVKEGEYLLSIDGVELTGDMNPYSLLENKLGKTIELKVGKTPDIAKARTIKIDPIESELKLRYLEWVEKNRKYVEEKSNGQIGYFHIPDMSEDGLLAFVKYYHGQLRKKGLIIDVRYNGGGFVSQMILERLSRVLRSLDVTRSKFTYTYPETVFHGYMVCLINHYSASDGDIFPYFFRKYGLGKLIGTRTWGGVIGIEGYTPLIDKGYITIPEYALFSVDRKWIIENRGVSPDIEVDNLPEDVIKGKDAQLDKAISYLMKKIKKSPKELPKPPKKYPIRKK